MSHAYAEWFAKIEKDYGEQLAEMPLPEGLPEHLSELIEAGDRETILFMLKVAWQLGAQAGLSAGVRLSQHGQPVQGAAARPGGLKA